MRKRALTLLELLIGFVLISLFSGVVGFKMHQIIQKKRFQSETAQLFQRFQGVQKLAIASQTDWKGELKKEGKRWRFHAYCIDSELKGLRPFFFTADEIFFNEEKKDTFEMLFFSSGAVSLEGTFQITLKKEKIFLKIPSFFFIEK